MCRLGTACTRRDARIPSGSLFFRAEEGSLRGSNFRTTRTYRSRWFVWMWISDCTPSLNTEEILIPPSVWCCPRPGCNPGKVRVLETWEVRAEKPSSHVQRCPFGSHEQEIRLNVRGDVVLGGPPDICACVIRRRGDRRCCMHIMRVRF